MSVCWFPYYRAGYKVLKNQMSITIHCTKNELKKSLMENFIFSAVIYFAILDKMLVDFFTFWPKFSHNFTSSETKQNYSHQKVNVRVASRVSKRLKTCGLRKFGDFKKIHETLGFDDTQLTTTQQANFDICAKTHKNLY